MTARRIVSPALCLLAVASVPAAAQEKTGRAFCATNPGDSVVYITPAFDNGMKAGSPYRSRLMGYEYREYIMGRFGLPPAMDYRITCSPYATEAEATVGRGVIEAIAAKNNNTVKEVDWPYQPDSAEVAFSYTAVREQGQEVVMPRGKNDKAYCASDQFAGAPLYTSAVFDIDDQAVNLAQWQIAFSKYLQGKYGYNVRWYVYCTDEGRGQPARLVAARIAGARAAGRKVIETGWKYGQAAAAVAAKPDDDPEPKPAPAPPAPKTDNRQLATADGSAALTQCQNDRLISGAFNCYMVQRAVYNYRMEKGAVPATVAELLSGDRLDCSGCINAMNTEMWASNRAMSNGFTLDKSKCVGQKFLASIKARPYVNRAAELFAAALKACPK